MTALTDEVSTILFLARWVPDWALAEAFHTNSARIYRLINSFGRYNIVKTTVKPVRIPTGLLADEHHTKRKGQKSYIATTAAEGCVFGSEFCESATGKELTKGYGVFKDEALETEPHYKPATVNTDGWKGTHQAWHTLFSAIAIIRCFLHAWLKIRERGKHLKERFFDIGKRVWEIYRCENKEKMRRSIDSLRRWSKRNLTGVVLEKVLDLCSKSDNGRNIWNIAVAIERVICWTD